MKKRGQHFPGYPLTHNMFQIIYTLLYSKHIKSKILKMDEDQTELYEIIKRNFFGCPNAENRITNITLF